MRQPRQRPAQRLFDPVPSSVAPEAAEHWLLVHTARHRRLNRVLRTADRRVFGGVAVAVGLTAVVLATLLVGWILDTVESNRGFARWDSSIAAWGADNASAVTTDLLRAVTHLGDTILVVIVMAVVAANDYRRSHNGAVVGFMATVAGGVVVINNALKWLIDRDRPVVQHLIGSAGSSFPSGHSATAAAGWAAIALIVARWVPPRFRWWLAAGAITIAVAVAASRALLGVHWFTDVVAGLIVGWTWFFVVAVIFGGRLQRFGDPAVRDPRSLEPSSAHVRADV
jgi:membrane-associated phospholipid phosphatase